VLLRNASFNTLVLGLAAFGLVISGCAKKPGAEGKWVYKDIVVPTGTANTKQLDAAKKALSVSSIDINKDKTFTWNLAQTPIAGTWTSTDTKVTLTPKTIAKRSVEEFKKYAPTVADDIHGSLSEDGKTLVLDGAGGQQGKISFSRSEG